MNRLNLVIAMLSICMSGISQSDTLVQYNSKIDSTVQSVRLHKKGVQLSDPILNFERNEQLKLSFDLMEGTFDDLAYEILLCDKDWRLSNLDASYYFQGFTEFYLQDYEASINTHIDYMHYRCVFPENPNSILMSGNYIIRVYEQDDPDVTIVQRRFMVTESLIKVDAKVVRPDVVMYSRTKQQINFKITYPSEISDPMINLFTTIRQNHSWVNSMNNIQADYVQNSTLNFNDPTRFTFDGNNEFRQIDLKYLRAGNIEIEKIVREGNQYHAYIKEKKKRTFNNYIYKEELNGRHLIKNDDATDSNIEADYFKVHFEFESNIFPEGDVYLYGEFTDWQIQEEYKLEYDMNSRKYFLSKDIKQGMLNFMYVVDEKQSGKKNFQIIEGNNFETENDYDIILYYRDISQGNDRILGIYSFNSLY